MTTIAERPHRVRVQNPSGPPVPNDDGGFAQDFEDANPPAVWASVEPASRQALERLGADTTTVQAQTTHVVTMPYHPELTTESQLLFNGRTLRVTGVSRPEERGRDSIAVCQEIHPPEIPS